MIERYQPHWDRDLARGKQAEFWVADIVKAFCEQRVEIKRDAWWPITRRIYVETHCVRSGEWCDSGINDTASPVWAFVAGGHPFMLVLTIEHLRRATALAVARDPRNGEAEEKDGSHPTRGVFVYEKDIMDARDVSLDEH
jgi:hypothetical protein